MKRWCLAALAVCLVVPPAVAAAAAADPSASSYQFALGKLLAVEGAVDDALAAFEAAERLAVPESLEQAYILLEHAQLLARMAQYARNPSARDESLRNAAAKITEARRIAPENLDVLRAVGDLYLDLAAIDPGALATARDALEAVRRRQPTDVQSSLTLGRIYLDQNQPAQAAAVFRSLVDNVPQQRMAYALLVEALTRAGKNAEAEQTLQEILGFDPGSLEARLTLADLQSRRGDARAVLATLRAAPEEVRSDPRLRRQIAWALYQGGELDEALTLVDQLSTRDPESHGLLLLRGLIFAAQGENDRALELLAKVRENQPRDPAVALTTARVMQRSGRRGEAVSMLTNLAAALGTDGKAEEAREVRLEAAQIAFDGKDYERVEEVLKPLLEPAVEPAVRAQAALLQADALSRAGRTEEALALLAREAGEKLSASLESRRGEVLVRGGREAEGLQILSGLAAKGDDASALAAAQGYQRLERYEDSIPVLEKLTAAHPDQIVAGFLLGAAYERTGQRDKSVAEFRRLLALDPEFHAALNYLGYTYADAGVNLDEALALVSRAVALDPDNGSYVDSLGWAYFRLGRFEEARKQLERAARLEPEDATLQEHLGDVYVALGQTERARQAYQRALELGNENEEQVRRKLGDLEETPRR